MKPSSAKNKGRTLQKWIVAKLHEYLDIPLEDLLSRSMGAGGEDIVMSSEARMAFPFSVEAKNTEKLNVWEAYKQAQANCPPGADPILFIKRNRSDPLIVMDAERFLYLLKKMKEELQCQS